MDKDLMKKIDEAFDGLLGEEVSKAQKTENDNTGNPETSDDDQNNEDKMIEKACDVLKKGNYKNDNEMIAALQKAGYNKSVCKKAMNKFKSNQVKKSIDDELNIDIESIEKSIKPDDDKTTEEVIDVSELLEEIPNMFTGLTEKIEKGLNQTNKVNMSIVKALKIIGHAVISNQEKTNELYDIVNALGNNPIVKGVKGGFIDKKFDTPEQKEVRKAVTDRESIEIQDALLKINTYESREALRNFSTTRKLDLLKGFKSDIEKIIGRELKID